MNNIGGHPQKATIDHVYPKDNGGTNHAFNKLPCCGSCNNLKANNSLQYFLEQIHWRIDANVGASKKATKRWAHMIFHISAIQKLMLNYKTEIFKKKNEKVITANNK